MSRKKWSLLVVALIGVVILAFTGAATPPDKKESPREDDKEVIQEFPSNDKMQTAWKVRWDTERGYGLVVKEAWFKRHPADDWIQVLGDSRVAEVLVCYHSGTPRFWQFSYGFSLSPATRRTAGTTGKLLGTPPTVVLETRDRGLIWSSGEESRRGEEMVLWGTCNAANDHYVSEYSFRDDGSIGFRLGCTGRSFPGRETEAYTNHVLWRLDVNLGAPNHNAVHVVESISHEKGDSQIVKKTMRAFNSGKEGWEDWQADRFTSIHVTNEKNKNKLGDKWSYELVSMRSGNTRNHVLKWETCLNHDFWVTKARPGERHYARLPEFTRAAESIMDTDIVLWHNTPMVHDPSSEDGEMKGNSLHGATRVTWVGFDLRPRNFFDRTPLYP